MVALAAWLAIGTGAGAEPYRPARDDIVVERLPAQLPYGSGQQRLWRQGLQAAPADIDQAIATARAYLAAARESADPRYESYAQAVLAQWWNSDDAPTQVLMLRAALRERRHDFAGALADLDRVLAREPANGQAWLSRASILQVRGDYAGSLQACRQLPETASAVVRAACTAGAAGLLPGGRNALDELGDALRRPGRDATETLAWGAAVYADVAIGQARDDEAEAAFRGGLALTPSDTYLLARYADFLIDRGRRAAALALIGPEKRAVGLSLRRARALAPGSAERASLSRRLEEIFAAARRRGDPPHLRSEAYFRLFVTGEPARALEAALGNFDQQREPFDARLVLEAALAHARPEAARPVVDWLRAAGVQHAVVHELVTRLQASAS